MQERAARKRVEVNGQSHELSTATSAQLHLHNETWCVIHCDSAQFCHSEGSTRLHTLLNMTTSAECYRLYYLYYAAAAAAAADAVAVVDAPD
eukprot:7285-Heterococcus_DN1.PRE.2